MFNQRNLLLILLLAIALVGAGFSSAFAAGPPVNELDENSIDYTMWHLGTPVGDHYVSDNLQKRLYNEWWYAGTGEFAGYDMFQTPQSGMGIGSNYVRSELREIIPSSATVNNDWGVSAAWGMLGYHRMTTQVKAAVINDNPRGKYAAQNYTCIGQLWGQSGGSGCMFELRYKDTGKFSVLPTKSGGNYTAPDLTIPVGQAFTVIYECSGGKLNVWVESQEAEVALTKIHEENLAAPDSGSYYFKAGNYDLSSDATGNTTPDPLDIHTLIGFKSIVVEHNPIKGKLTYADGSPIADQTVDYVLNGSGASNIKLSAQTDAAGYYYIPNVPSNGGLITAAVAISVPQISDYTANKPAVINVPATSTAQITGVRSGSAYDIVYTSDLEHYFSGRILYQESPRSAKVELFNSDQNPVASAATEENGAYTLSLPAPLTGARYTLVITKPGYLSYTIKNLTLTEGEDIETIDLHQLAGDINGDGYVNSEDLVCLISEFGGAPVVYSNADIDGDGLVNSVDLTYLLAGFGRWNVVVDRAIND